MVHDCAEHAQNKELQLMLFASLSRLVIETLTNVSLNHLQPDQVSGHHRHSKGCMFSLLKHWINYTGFLPVRVVLAVL